MRFFPWQFGGLWAVALCALLAGCADELPSPAFADAEFPPCEVRLGCATAHNIAAMVDRPADLALPRRERPRDAVRREAVLSAYRQDGLQSSKPTLPAGAAKP
jgi:type IV pilus biogenesis protein CpaD/CtpE